MLTFFLLCIKHIFSTNFRSDFWLEVKPPIAAPCLSGAQDEPAAAGGEQGGVHSVFRKSTLFLGGQNAIARISSVQLLCQGILGCLSSQTQQALNALKFSCSFHFPSLNYLLCICTGNSFVLA